MFTIIIKGSGANFRLRAMLSGLTLAIAFIAGGVSSANAQAFSEGFDVVPVPGWTTQNNSTPVGTTNWFQGSTVFTAQSGPATSYIGANFNNSTGTNPISNWLVSPNRTFSNGDVIKFWTRTATGSQYPDRLQVRLSTAGTSTNVGTGVAGVGDFTTLLTDINPNLDIGGYPEVWTEYTITLSGLPAPTSGRLAFRYYVQTSAGPLGNNSNFIGIDTFSYTPTAAPPGDAPVDLNGDGKTDYVIVRNTNVPAGQATWFWNLNGSADPTAASAWGLTTTDFFVPSDYDGDGKDDIAVWRPGAATVATFYILNSATSTLRQEAFGQTGDDPTVVADYNGDGKDDIAVYREGASAGQQSTWFYRTVANGAVTFTPWGTFGDFPAPGDYDGDGKSDFSVQRSNGNGQGSFWTLLATGSTSPVVVFGTPTDVIVPGDYDGDGKTDYATVRGVSGAIQWQWLASSSSTINYRTFGASATDIPAQGDYDGDGKTDPAVWRPSVTAGASAFWSLGSATSTAVGFPFGTNGDYPVGNYNSH